MRTRLLLALLASLVLAAPAHAVTPGWSPTGSMSAGRMLHAMVQLDNGKVLVAGGYAQFAPEDAEGRRSAELWDPATGQWSSAGNMAVARSEFKLIKLPNGKALAIGGQSLSNGAQTSTEVYDPATNAWSPGPSMATKRADASIVELPDHRVLVAGGYNNYRTYNNNAELYNPATNTFTPAGGFAQVAGGAAAAYGGGNTVVMAGGEGGPQNSWIGYANRYDVAHNQWIYTPDMPTARDRHAAGALPSGSVLFMGGSNASGPMTTVERYDPVDNLWFPAAPMSARREWLTSTTLTNGQLLAAGGNTGNVTPVPTSELYTESTGAWTPAGTMVHPRFAQTALLLADGRVMVTGGMPGDDTGLSRTAEIYTPTTSVNAPAAVSLGDVGAGVGGAGQVVLTNTGSLPLFTDSLALTGSSDFSIAGSGCTGPVWPGASCAIDVRVAPPSVGAPTATLTLSSNTAANTISIELSARAVATAFVLDSDRDGLVDANDRCPKRSGPANRAGCPKGLLADPSIRYRQGKRSIKVIAYYVKATTGAKITVTCSKKACKKTVAKGKGKRRVRIKGLNNRTLKNGTTITVSVSMKNRETTVVHDRVSRGRRIEGRPRCLPVGC